MLRGSILLLLGFCFADVWGVERGGVEIPDSVTLDDGTRLVLNGAGIRKRLFVKVYVGALYLPQPESDAEQAIGLPGAKRVLMHFVYDEVAKTKITAGWDRGFEANLGAEAYRQMRPRLDRFNAMFEDMRAGDRIELTYLPRQGTRVSVRGKEQGVVEGEDFAQSLMRVWLGDEPADPGLKRAMLGQD